MSCYFCKNYKGLHNFCAEDRYYVETGNESLDCQFYQYNGELKYYSYLSKRDELEVQTIMRGVFSYIMRIGFDDLTTGIHETTKVWSKLSEWAKKASETIDEELEGVFNEVK